MFGWVPENSQEIIFKCLFHSKIKKKKKKPKFQLLNPQPKHKDPKKKIQKQSIWMINIRKFSTKYANTIQDNKLLSRN